MPSFDVVSEVDQVELANALDQANKEISNRFDFKGSDSRVEYKEKDFEITLFADDDFKLGQVKDVLVNKMTKRGVDTRVLGEGKIEKISGNKLKEIVKVQNGIAIEKAKEIVKIIKESKIKVQGSIQGETVRVSGGKRDDLQATMQLLKTDFTELPLQFNNFRD